MLELTDTNNTAYLFLSAANRWLEVRTVSTFGSTGSNVEWLLLIANFVSSDVLDFITAWAHWVYGFLLGLFGCCNRSHSSSGCHLDVILWTSTWTCWTGLDIRSHCKSHTSFIKSYLKHSWKKWFGHFVYFALLPFKQQLESCICQVSRKLRLVAAGGSLEQTRAIGAVAQIRRPGYFVEFWVMIFQPHF